MIAAALLLAAPAAEARILWVDATANLNWSIQPAKVAEFCRNAKEAGFNEIIVDVKPINGKLLFDAPASERFTKFRDVEVPEGYDLLKVFCSEARKVGLRTTAGVNVFSEGHSYFPGVGKAYEENWQTLCASPVYELELNDGSVLGLQLDTKAKPKPGQAALSPDGSTNFHEEDRVRAASGVRALRYRMEIVPQTTAYPDMVAVFVDPLHAAARKRFLDVLRALGAYDIDGVALDRLRFPGLYGGFGPEMRAEFERRYGAVGKWPDSVFQASGDPLKPVKQGPRFAEWMQFRAEVITEMLAEIRSVCRAVNSKWTVGAYVGAGWETYYEVGVNYTNDLAVSPYPWAYPEYGLAGYAKQLDYLMPGVFYRVARSVDPGVEPGRGRFTVEGGSQLMVKLAGDSTLIYPALYGLDWEGNIEGLRSAVRACRKVGLGVMFFDASYVVKHNWWPVFREEFLGAPEAAPHWLPSYPRRTPTGKVSSK